MADVKRNGSIINTLKQHALTAISYLIPIVVGGGFLLAIGSLMGEQLLRILMLNGDSQIRYIQWVIRF